MLKESDLRNGLDRNPDMRLSDVPETSGGEGSDSVAPKRNSLPLEPEKVDGVAANFNQVLELIDDEETRHRQEAIDTHLARFMRQTIAALWAVFLVAWSVSFWRVVYSAAGMTYPLSWPLAAYESAFTQIFLRLSGDYTSVWLFLIALIVPLIMFGNVLSLMWYCRERDRDWRVAEALSDAREPIETAKGYMSVFRLYARTKRHAFFSILFAMAGVWWAGTGIWAFIVGSGSSIEIIALVASAILQMAFSGWMLYLGYDISRRFVPGKVLVSKTLITSTLAATSQTDYTVARQYAGGLETELIEEKPWWFYSYHKAKKRYT